MKEFSYVIKDAIGIHARPAGLLVKTAKSYESKVTIQKGEKSADAKKLMALMGLAVKCGDEVKFQIEGADENEAAAELEQFMNDNL